VIWLGVVAAIVPALVVLYLVASYIGAIIPQRPAAGRAPGHTETVYLLINLLHADIVIPVNPQIRSRFSHLAGSGLPIFDPELNYLIFGWGSRAFYTTARNLADIRPGPTLRAIIGDNSVMHVVPLKGISQLENLLPVNLPPGGTARLLDFIEASFTGQANHPVHLAGASYGIGDEFFASPHHFNIFNPCNIWTAQALRAAGLSTGYWTPTTHSLKLSLQLHAPKSVRATAY
jgi:uncharacterized protein (TIGR02117 family)